MRSAGWWRPSPWRHRPDHARLGRRPVDPRACRRHPHRLRASKGCASSTPPTARRSSALSTSPTSAATTKRTRDGRSIIRHTSPARMRRSSLSQEVAPVGRSSPTDPGSARGNGKAVALVEGERSPVGVLGDDRQTRASIDAAPHSRLGRSIGRRDACRGTRCRAPRRGPTSGLSPPFRDRARGGDAPERPRMAMAGSTMLPTTMPATSPATSSRSTWRCGRAGRGPRSPCALLPPTLSRRICPRRRQ